MAKVAPKPESWCISKGGVHRAWIYNETYDVGVLVLWPVNSKQLAAAVKAMGFEASDEDCEVPGDGACYIGFPDEKVHVIAFSKNSVRNGGAGDVAHEALHYVGAILADRGIAYSVENDEPFAYLLGWLVNEIMRLRKSVRKSRSPGTP